MEGTLKPASNFNPAADAEKLRKAMKGIGTDEDAIISVWGYRTALQRAEITKTYKQSFGRDLDDDFKSELTGNFEQMCRWMTHDMAGFDATCLHHAMKGAGTDEDCLIEIICTRTNQQLMAIKQVYKQLFNHDLEKTVENETSGYFRRLLVSLLQAHREESSSVNSSLVQQDVETLYQAGPAHWGTEESEFNKVLCQRSHQHLRAVFQEYQKRHGKTLEEIVDNEFSGDVRKGLLTIVKCVRDVEEYFAEALYLSMKGLGTHDNTLQRIVVSRCEWDMVQIKRCYERKYGHSAGTDIRGDVSGDYRKLVLALIGEH